MLITRKSPFTNEVHLLDLDITEEELNCWKKGEPAQNAFPRLNPDEREFLMTGITKEEWNKTFEEQGR